MTNLDGFWSYVHSDDDADRGRISQLAKDVVDQYEMLTGEKIILFLDKDAIKWGEDWHNKIDTNLASVAFFIPVITPRYFMSVECRRELQSFARLATDLGVKELILPLLYVNVPEINNKETTDDLIRLVQTFQWENWLDIRFLAVDSENYRRRVAGLATRIFEANRQAEKPLIVVSPKTDELLVESKDESLVEGADDTPGFIDLLADAEEKMNIAPDTLSAITEEVAQIGVIMNEATSDMEKPISQKSGFAQRQMIVRKVAVQISKPTEKIWTLSNELSSQLHSVDKGYRLIFEKSAEEIKSNPTSRISFCTFFMAIRGMATSSKVASVSIQGMIDATGTLDKMSRDLRPVMRRLRQGLTIVVELNGLFDEWISLIEMTGVSCEDIDPIKPINTGT